MAAGNFTVLNLAAEKIGDGIDLQVDDLYVVLCDNSQALTAAFAGGSGQALYADLTGEVSGAGYTAGGEQLTGVTFTGYPALLDADPTTWTAASFTAKYVVLVNRSLSAEPIIGFADLETTDPSGRVSAGGDFTLTWPAGFFDLARA